MSYWGMEVNENPPPAPPRRGAEMFDPLGTGKR